LNCAGSGRIPQSAIRTPQYDAKRVQVGWDTPGQYDRFVALFRLPNGEGGPGAEAVVSLTSASYWGNLNLRPH